MRQLAEQLVAGVMAEAVVDLLEVVDIDGDDRKGAVAGLPLLQSRQHAAAVEQAGQRVGDRVVIELADLVVELGESGQHGAFEFGGLEIPGADLADLFRGRLRVHLPGAAGQLPERSGNQPGQPPDAQQGQQRHRKAVAQNLQHQPMQLGQGGLGGALRDYAPAGAGDRRVAGEHVDPIGIGHPLRTRIAADRRFDDRVAWHDSADPFGIMVIKDAPLPIDHIQA
ncbi:hypothetical protein D3C78_1259870 [compost metagenome]